MRRLCPALVSFLLFAACTTTSSFGDAPLRPAEDTPDAFLVREGIELRPTRQGGFCRSPMIDARTRNEIILERSQAGIGDYAVPSGRYGVAANELLRIDCSTGKVLGIVKGD